MSVPIVNQTPSTKELQFKLYATKFPVWWTHNSIDKPDPDYFKKLDLATDDTGFNWVEVPFTFNFKDQFTGTIVADDQYYTMFKLVDSKDTKYPNKYYLVESLNKAFNGGYELEIRLDVFTSYGLDFWVNGVNNPDINTKTVNLNRTNHSFLLLRYYYNYVGFADNDFSIWTYKDPLLDFKHLPMVSAIASYVQKDKDNKYNVPAIWLNPFPTPGIGVGSDPGTGGSVKIENDGSLTFDFNNNPWNYGWYTINGIHGDGYEETLSGAFVGNVRYYVFKPFNIKPYVNDTEGYIFFYSIMPNTQFVDGPSFNYNNAVNYNPNLTLSPRNQPGKEVFRIHARDADIEVIMKMSGTLNSQFVGIFEGPPLWAFSQVSFSQPNYPRITHSVIRFIVKSGATADFLIGRVQLTPYKNVGIRYSNPQPDPLQATNDFTIFNLNDINYIPNMTSDLTNKLLRSDTGIVFYDGSAPSTPNNAYIWQKSQVQDLAFQPFAPYTIFSSFNVDWENDMKGHGFNLPQRVIASLRIPDTLFFNEEGFRYSYISNQLNSDLTIWTTPGFLPSGSDSYSTYITQALITQNTSMAIAKQQESLGIANSVIGGVLGVAGGIVGGGKGGILSGISSIANMATGIASSVLAYQNQQKMYDAQNSSTRAVLGYKINSSTDNDTAKNLMADNAFILKNSWWGYLAIQSFNWMIPIKMPTLSNDLIYYNNLIYLNGFYVNTPTAISSLKLDWDNRSAEAPGMMPHLYYDIDITPEVLKYHYKTINLELLNAITTLFNNGIRFWHDFPNYNIPWYWITHNIGNSTVISAPDPIKNFVEPTAPPDPPPRIITHPGKLPPPIYNPVHPNAQPTFGYGSNMNAHDAIIPNNTPPVDNSPVDNSPVDSTPDYKNIPGYQYDPSSGEWIWMGNK